MLERYFVKPRTVDRIRASWIGPEIEQYVTWMDEREYAPRSVCHRVPVLVSSGSSCGPPARARSRNCPVMPRGSWLTG